MNVGKAKIRDFVSRFRYPILSGLTQIDAPDYVATIELISRLFDMPIGFSRSGTIVSFHMSGAEAAILSIDESNLISAADVSILSEIDVLLRAARIHFVESFEWVNFPPEMRSGLILREASELGLTDREFIKKIGKWVD